MNEEIHEAIVLGFRGIEELAVAAARRETGGTYDPESLSRAETFLATALDKARLAKAMVVVGVYRLNKPPSRARRSC
jgi:HD-like signal output (HDOD) protein